MPGWELLVGLRTPPPWGKDAGTEGGSRRMMLRYKGVGDEGARAPLQSHL